MKQQHLAVYELGNVQYCTLLTTMYIVCNTELTARAHLFSEKYSFLSQLKQLTFFL